MAPKKLVAVFLVCIVVAAAMHVSEAQEDFKAEYKSCFEKCEQDCKDEGNGSSFCEMKCDADCLAKEAAARLHINKD